MTISEAYAFLDSIRRTEAEIVKKQLQHDELQMISDIMTQKQDRWKERMKE